MTRTFDGMVKCPECGHTHTQETAFERWMRDHERLDSRNHGIVRFDCDVLIHRYMFSTDKRKRREIQCLMLIEVKSFSAIPSPAQLDTLSLFSQVIRNRRTNIHKKKQGVHLNNHVPLAEAWSRRSKRYIRLKLFGAHLLQMDSDSPDTSTWLGWDYKTISLDQLVGLLRFDLDPDSLNPVDWRLRYSNFDEHRRQKTFIDDSADEA